MKIKYPLLIIMAVSLPFLLPEIGLAEPLSGNLSGMAGRSFPQQGTVLSHPNGNFSHARIHSNGNFSHQGMAFSGHDRASIHEGRTQSHERSTFFHQDRARNIDRRGFDRQRRSSVIIFNDYPYYYPYYYENEPIYYTAPTAPPYNTVSLSIVDIVNMASRGVPDDEIINEITRTGTVFNLTSETITYLKQNGVSDRVIDFMLASATNARQY